MFKYKQGHSLVMFTVAFAVMLAAFILIQPIIKRTVRTKAEGLALFAIGYNGTGPAKLVFDEARNARTKTRALETQSNTRNEDKGIITTTVSGRKDEVTVTTSVEDGSNVLLNVTETAPGNLNPG